MDRSEIRKLLVIAPNWIGDAVMALPAISRLREDFPSARITILGFPHISQLFQESPLVDEILEYNDRSKKTGLFTTAREIQQCKFDMAILFPNSFRTAMIVRLAGVPLRAGYNRDGRGFLLNLPVSLDPEIKKSHQREYYLRLVKSLETCLSERPTAGQENASCSQGFIENRRPKRACHSENRRPKRACHSENRRPEGACHSERSEVTACAERSEESPPFAGFSQSEILRSLSLPQNYRGRTQGKLLFLSKDEERQALKTLRDHNITPDDLVIGMNPGAAYGSSKRWHPERFGLVARALTTQYNARVIVFGGNAEVDIAKEITEKAGAPLINMAGRTSVRELMALIAHCRLLITNDSGPMHIATALAVPVVAIFGSTDPLLTGPLGDGHIVIKKEVPCSPCFLRKCPTDLKCMDLIRVDDVLEGVEKILK